MQVMQDMMAKRSKSVDFRKSVPPVTDFLLPQFYNCQVATGDESNFTWVAQSGPFNKLNVLASGIPVE